MQGDFYRPASGIPIKALIALQFLCYPQPPKNFVVADESFLRIGGQALKVKSHGAVHLHHRRRGFLARKGSGIGSEPASQTQPGGATPVAPPTSGGVLDTLKKADEQQNRAPAAPQAPRSQ